MSFLDCATNCVPPPSLMCEHNRDNCDGWEMYQQGDLSLLVWHHLDDRPTVQKGSCVEHMGCCESAAMVKAALEMLRKWKHQMQTLPPSSWHLAWFFMIFPFFSSVRLAFLPLSAVTRVTKQLMLLEEAKQRLEEELEKSREEAKTNGKEVQVLRTRLRDAVTREEHCSITENLRRCPYLSYFIWHSVSLRPSNPFLLLKRERIQNLPSV